MALKDHRLSARYPLTRDQQDEYRKEGFILLRNICDPSLLSEYRDEIRSVVQKVTDNEDSQGRISDYGSMFTQVTNVWRMNKKAQAFVFAERFARIAAMLMGVKGVRLYHDQALVKEPGGLATPWHQDQYYWPLDTKHTITMWMPLIDVSPEMGTMSFVPGSHSLSSLQRMSISDASQSYFEKYIRESGVDIPQYSLAAGDATFHAGWTLHAAHANKSADRREVIAIIYFADGTKIKPPENEHQKVDMKVFLPESKPGEPADGHLNPLLFSL